jgi:(1->4)-alpha-D-glucan 1-alpha-D-glucosylmutase
MNGTSTHDTKRGEDVRARINVLSEIPEEWESYLKQWQEINAAQKDCVAGLDVPAPNDEYFLYQTLLGAFPFYESEYPSFVERIKEYVIKAIREAKVHTGWLRPDCGYEDAFIKFVEKLLKKEENEFLAAFRPLQRKVQYYGVFNSLSQTFLKITSPGVPDFYQGTELWDLSLVDPDNRRLVDFEKRAEFLKEIKTGIESDILGMIGELLLAPESGKIKMFLVYQALKARRDYLELFQRGDYQKLVVLGSLKDHIVAFSRKWGDSTAIIIAPRLLSHLVKEGEYPLGEQVWHETRICLPSGSSLVWQNAITQQEHQGEEEDTLWIRDVLSHFPVALLINQGQTHNNSESEADNEG